jgi:hypothetical protein
VCMLTCGFVFVLLWIFVVFCVRGSLYFTVRSPLIGSDDPPPRALACSMAENQWVVTFEDVQNPAQMQSRLDDSQFAKRCDSFLSRIVGRNIICSFCSIIGKQALQKKCVQTFKDYGTFKRYTIIQTPGRLNRNPESRKTGKMEHLCVGP